MTRELSGHKVCSSSAAHHNRTATRPVLVFVLGISRSGTSALTRVLSLCGCALPSQLVGGMPDNPRGHWEPRSANYLNEVILRRCDSSLFDPTLRLQDEGAFDAKEKSACIAEIGAFLTTLPAAPLVVIKDIRITVLSELWFEAAHLTGYDVATVIALRHPQEVIESIAVRSGATPELSCALWLKFNLLAERATRGQPRVFVHYADLLKDWRREMRRVSASLGIELSSANGGAIEDFLTKDLHNQRYNGPAPKLFGTDWVSTVYEVLCAAARDEPWDADTLDKVFEAYGACESDFRIALENFHRLHMANRLLRPSVFRLILESLALAHRRRGTWA